MYLRLSKRSLALLLSISAAGIAPPVFAQESTELPPVLVEGATIDVLPAPKPAAAGAAKPKPKSQPAVQQQPLDIDVPSTATSGIPLDEIGT